MLAHVGIVALVGRANVGKSTLMNRILAEKVSIVSPVVQTTRNLIRGVLTDSRGQMVLLDTPGIHKAHGELGRVLNRMARRAVEGVDVVALILDGSVPPRAEDEGWMKKLTRWERPVVVVINKSDVRQKYESDLRAAWDRAAAPNVSARCPTWMTVSALIGENVDALVDVLFRLLPSGPPLFPEDILTDFPRKLAMADAIREKLFFLLRKELPHAIAVRIDEIEENDAAMTIRATILVDKPSQKPIVVGMKGRLLRKVRRQSEAELRTLYEKDVTVDVWVKVQKHWAKNYWIRKQLGYL